MIIVTGGAGFIGSALVWGLNQRGEEDILIVDALAEEEEKRKNLALLRYTDYLDKDEFLKEVVKGDVKFHVDALIHMGACSDTTEQDRDYLMRNNYEYTKHLVSWAVNHGVHFIYASSGATYGDGSRGYSDAENELEALKPLNPYGESKHLFDLWAKSNGFLREIVGLKFFNVYGPNEYHKGEMQSVVIKAFDQIEAEGKVKLFKSYRKDYADGEQKRDFLYVKDAVEIILFFLDHRELNGIFNVGLGKARTWNALVNAIFAARHDSRRVIEYVDMPIILRDQYQYFTEADVSKLQQVGYSREITSLEDGVKDYVCNYLVGGRKYLDPAVKGQ